MHGSGNIWLQLAAKSTGHSPKPTAHAQLHIHNIFGAISLLLDWLCFLFAPCLLVLVLSSTTTTTITAKDKTKKDKGRAWWTAAWLLSGQTFDIIVDKGLLNKTQKSGGETAKRSTHQDRAKKGHNTIVSHGSGLPVPYLTEIVIGQKKNGRKVKGNNNF